VDRNEILGYQSFSAWPFYHTSGSANNEIFLPIKFNHLNLILPIRAVSLMCMIPPPLTEIINLIIYIHLLSISISAFSSSKTVVTHPLHLINLQHYSRIPTSHAWTTLSGWQPIEADIMRHSAARRAWHWRL